MGVWYCTREDVKSALDIKETARNNAQVDRVIEGESRGIEGCTHRKFGPVLATRYFDWPNDQYARPWRLWLDADELISVTTLTVGGVVIPSSDYFLEPVNTGPPFTHIEIDLASQSAFSSGDTHQRSIEVAGLYGYSNEELTIGTLNADLTNSLTASPSITMTTGKIGVGDILRIDNERMIVTERTMVDSTQDLQGLMDASAAADIAQVTNGSAFRVGQVLLVDSERMLIHTIAGNNLIVKRAWDGTTLDIHSGSSVFVLTGVTVERAQLGTSLATHSNGATVSQWQVPGLLREWCTAEAVNALQQELSGYARTTGSGANAKEATGGGLDSIRERAEYRYKRKARLAAV